MSKGIDVSIHNGTIDWQKVKAAGIDFAIIRAGYGKTISQKDAQFENNYAGCKVNGIPCGAYWYSYAVTPAEAEAEARTFIQAIAGKKFEYPVYFDVEEKNALATGKKNVSAIIRAFCSIMEKAGYWVGVYASRAHIQSYIDDDTQKRYTLWVAEWGNALHYSGDYGMWQYSEKGKVSGINGNVDLDDCQVDFPTVIKAAGKNGYDKPIEPTEPKHTVMYIPGINAADVQTYLTWCAEVGAGNYRDTAEDFKRFLES